MNYDDEKEMDEIVNYIIGDSPGARTEINAAAKALDICKACGKEFAQWMRKTKSYYCPECARAKKRESYMKQKERKAQETEGKTIPAGCEELKPQKCEEKLKAEIKPIPAAGGRKMDAYDALVTIARAVEDVAEALEVTPEAVSTSVYRMINAKAGLRRKAECQSVKDVKQTLYG
jgi:predicted Zn-ribbon and HTH transcriptional regulator